MKAAKARKEAKRLIIAEVGPGGFEAFLKARQPALEDRSGAELMNSDPAALLVRLRALEAEEKGGGRDG